MNCRQATFFLGVMQLVLTQSEKNQIFSGSTGCFILLRKFALHLLYDL